MARRSLARHCAIADATAAREDTRDLWARRAGAAIRIGGVEREICGPSKLAASGKDARARVSTGALMHLQAEASRIDIEPRRYSSSASAEPSTATGSSPSSALSSGT